MAARLSGVSAHTLRAWERRYGFPAPARTTGGARRYTREDIERLGLIVQALDAGYRAGEVVPARRESLRALLSPDRGTAPTDEDENSLVAQTLALVQRDDMSAAHGEIRRAATLLGPRRFVTEFAHPLAEKLGLGWESGTVSIRQEHLTTDILRTQLRVLLAGYDAPDGRPRVLLAALPGEQHTLALDMVALYINLNGGSASSLGEAAPIAEIAAAASELRADVVGVSISGSYKNTLARSHVVSLRASLAPAVALWLGGQGSRALDLARLSVERAISWTELAALLRAAR